MTDPNATLPLPDRLVANALDAILRNAEAWDFDTVPAEIDAQAVTEAILRTLAAELRADPATVPVRQLAPVLERIADEIGARR